MGERKKTIVETKVLAEIIIFAALSAGLYTLTLPFLTLPFGGSVTAGSMVPIFWLSLRRGHKVGIIGGIIFGLAALPIDIVRLPYSPIAANPASILFDYVIAFGVLGVAGLFKKHPLVGITIASTLKFLSHFISGIIFWSIYTPEDLLSKYGVYAPIVYSAIYNGSFMTAETIISLVLMYSIIKYKYLKIYM
jgi:thiamine transporter